MDGWKHSLATGEDFEMEFPLKGADGRYRWFLTRVSPFRDTQGRITRWFGTNTDIDDQRNIRERLASALSLRDEFLSIASHELKTPLTSLKLQLQLANRAAEGLTEKQVSKVLQTCLRQTTSLTDLVDALLDVTRIQAGKFSLHFEPIDLGELVRDVMGRFSHQLETAKMPVKMSLEKSVIGQWDRRRLEQVITNLISNAIKYAPRASVTVTTERTNAGAALTIQDGGPEFPKVNMNSFLNDLKEPANPMSPDWDWDCLSFAELSRLIRELFQFKAKLDWDQDFVYYCLVADARWNPGELRCPYRRVNTF